MKTLIVALSLVACMNAFAGELPVAAPANEPATISLSGKAANDLMNAIEAMGAKETVVPDATFLTLDRLVCSQGFNPRSGAFAHCTAFQGAEKLEIAADAAEAMIALLADAGVGFFHYPEMRVLHAGEVRC